MTQNYQTHAHKPMATIVATVAWVAAAVGFTAAWDGASWGWPVGIGGLLVAVLSLITISRVYTTRLQDRIIVLEERLRAERLLAPAQLAAWQTLSPKQVVALRFASDSEFAALAARAAGENLKPDAIKRAVTAWRADHRRT